MLSHLTLILDLNLFGLINVREFDFIYSIQILTKQTIIHKQSMQIQIRNPALTANSSQRLFGLPDFVDFKKSASKSRKKSSR